MTRSLLTGNGAAAWGARLAGVDYVPVSTSLPYDVLLLSYFGKRKRIT